MYYLLLYKGKIKPLSYGKFLMTSEKKIKKNLSVPIF